MLKKKTFFNDSQYSRRKKIKRKKWHFVLVLEKTLLDEVTL